MPTATGCSVDYGPAADPHDGPGEPLVESVWVEPYPDEKLGLEDGFAAPESASVYPTGWIDPGQGGRGRPMSFGVEPVCMPGGQLENGEERSQ